MILSAFQKLNPDVKGMTSVEESVADQLAVIDQITLKDSGKLLSHHGDRNWF
jgi:hypothetical protein